MLKKLRRAKYAPIMHVFRIRNFSYIRLKLQLGIGARDKKPSLGRAVDAREVVVRDKYFISHASVLPGISI